MARLNSKLACEWSVERIPDPHLWTFTLPVVLEPREAARRWSRLQRDLVRTLSMWGVRVFEAHPGGHGLHVHLVVSGRFEVNDVRPLSMKHGFGRIHVLAVSRPQYVAKYLCKSEREDGWSWRGLRLWAVLGKRLWPVIPTRVCDVVNECSQRKVYNRLKELLGGVGDFREARRLFMVSDWLLSGLVSLGHRSRVGEDGKIRCCLIVCPSFETSFFENCVFERRVRTAPHRKGGAEADAERVNLV